MLERCETLSAGMSTHLERLVLRGGSLAKLRFPTTVGVLRHPREGLVLFDTGYHPRVLDATRHLPRRLYRWLAPFEVRAQDTVAAQLAARGIDARQVRHVVVSHLHPDHIGGLRDFPAAILHISRVAFETVSATAGLRRQLLAFYPELLPDDFASRVHWVDRFDDAGVGAFQRTRDLFGDGSVRLLPLPGHARGQLGLWATASTGRRALFCADACWVSQGFREQRPASRITGLIADDAAQTRDTLRRLHETWAADRELRVIPAHCPEITAGEIT